MLNAILYHYIVGFYVVNISSIVKIVNTLPIRQLLLLNLIMILILMSGVCVKSWVFLLFLLLRRRRRRRRRRRHHHHHHQRRVIIYTVYRYSHQINDFATIIIC